MTGETTAQYNKRQKILRKRLDKIAQKKIAESALDRSTHLGKVENVDTSPDWEDDKRFNARDKPPLP